MLQLLEKYRTLLEPGNDLYNLLHILEHFMNLKMHHFPCVSKYGGQILKEIKQKEGQAERSIHRE